jgi:hypothetical protein
LGNGAGTDSEAARQKKAEQYVLHTAGGTRNASRPFRQSAIPGHRLLERLIH